MTDTAKPINDSDELTEAELDKVAGAGINAGGNNDGAGGGVFERKQPEPLEG
jgi:hypothetical protein